MKRFVFSDSHGGYKAMVQCLERCGFNNEEDQLYFLGDVVDGWSETKSSITLLLGIKKLVHLLGNHDQWAIKGFSGKLFKSDSEDQMELYSWIMQGGSATVKSYAPSGEMPPEHLQFLLDAKPYHVTEDNILLVHAGFDPEKPIEETDTDWLIWSRDFINHYFKLYKNNKYRLQPTQKLIIPDYKEVYVGHSPTIRFDEEQVTPLQMGNIIMMDTGAAFTGRLSIMDMDTKEVWQSDPVMALYPDEFGRNEVTWTERQKKY
jgi:serine/threonine protein phosphatase 1